MVICVIIIDMIILSRWAMVKMIYGFKRLGNWLEREEGVADIK
jgi:hypothetical protein